MDFEILIILLFSVLAHSDYSKNKCYQTWCFCAKLIKVSQLDAILNKNIVNILLALGLNARINTMRRILVIRCRLDFKLEKTRVNGNKTNVQEETPFKIDLEVGGLHLSSTYSMQDDIETCIIPKSKM